MEEAYGSKYVAVFDPLDGSSNVDAAVATGTIFGIFRQNVDCIVKDDEERLDAEETRCLLNTLQPGRSLVAAGYCMYSSSTVLVFTLGDGVQGFTLDPLSREFVLSHANVTVPPAGAARRGTTRGSTRPRRLSLAPSTRAAAHPPSMMLGSRPAHTHPPRQE